MPKRQRQTRLHHYILGPPHSPRICQDREGLQAVVLRTSARDFLVSLLSDPIPRRAGLLFGEFSGSRLQVHHAVLGERGLVIDPFSPFHLDGRYALGWADAIAELTDLEWVGLWAVHGHRPLPDHHGNAAFLYLAYEQGLIDRDSVLLVAGWREGRLTAEALQITEDGIVRFPVEMTESAP